MSSRKPVYVISVILLAVVLSIPQVLLGAIVVFVANRIRIGMVSAIPLLGGEGKDWLYRPEHVPFWQNKFIEVTAKGNKPGPKAKLTLAATDPENGDRTEFDFTLTAP